MSRTLIPLRWISAGPDGLTINIHVAPLLSSAEEAVIDAVVNEWYGVGFAGAFGGSGFHWLDKLPVYQGVVRYAIDPGRSDVDRALEALREALTRLAGFSVNGIVIADEVASL